LQLDTATHPPRARRSFPVLFASPIQKRYFWILLAIAAAAFVALGIANASASQNTAMVAMFEPDEAACLPTVFHMTAPAESLEKALRAFIFYDYYYYGFPFFGYSAALLLPLRWLGGIGNIPLVMLVLRQGVSVLPMLLALLLLVYMQDGYRTYRSPLLFVFLLSVPAVLANDFWWHADSLTFLFVVLTLFFLWRDRLNFGRNFVLAAIMNGIAVAAKLVGLYFFLCVGLTLVLGLLLKKASWKRLAAMALAYIGVMALAIVAANPFLLSHWARAAYFQTMVKQSELLSQGYGVVYGKGFLVSWPIVNRFYGEWPLLLVSLGAVIWGIARGKDRLLHSLILAWFIPLSISVFWFTHFKYQYWLPVALPLFSCLVVLLPERWKDLRIPPFNRILRVAGLLVILAQFGGFALGAVNDYSSRLHRAEGNARIEFYQQAVQALRPLPQGPLHVYYDYRMYMPETPGWSAETNFDLLDYAYIQQGHFDVLLLLEQRIKDYLSPNAVGINPEQFALNQAFYRDAEKASINGYHLVYRDEVGLVYLSDRLYAQYFP
jgi:hypothetical protein